MREKYVQISRLKEKMRDRDKEKEDKRSKIDIHRKEWCDDDRRCQKEKRRK